MNTTVAPSFLSRVWRMLLWLLLIIVVLLVLWTWFTLSWSYGEGERAGVLQKFSHKGWLCKTYEGELALIIGKRGRHVKLRPGCEVDSASLAELVDAAYADIRARLGK